MNFAEKIKKFFTKLSATGKVKDKNKFADIEEQVISKIRRTPYWKDFPNDSKERMISKYFDRKIKTSAYMGIPYNVTEKQIFIKEVLKSVV